MGPAVLESAETALFRARRDALSIRVDRACGRARRDPASVTVIAVSKTALAGQVAAAVAAGFTTLGESRVQEAAAKIPLVAGARWHLVGRLQGNKARQALELFDMIETVDSVDLAVRLDRIWRELGDDLADGGLAGELGEARPGRFPVLLQVNVDADPAKAGFVPEEAEEALHDLVALPNLDVRGLMTVGLLFGTPEEARPTFVALRELSERLRVLEPALGPELSMGMTDDFDVAIEEGATLVRVGRAIFGTRPPA